MDIEVAVKADAELGEGPSWDPATRTLLWIDIRRHQILRSDLGSGETEVRQLDEEPGCVVPTQSGGLLYATPRGFVAADDLHGEERLVADVEADKPENKMNDGKVDPLGRMWAGTLAGKLTPGAGAFYCLGADGAVRQVLSGLTVPNGLAFNADASVCYLVDTLRSKIMKLTLDADGSLVRNDLLLDVSNLAGVADGMTMDEAGCLWLAYCKNSRVYRLTPDGGIDREIVLPVSCPTSVAFGGDDLDVLYVTTSLGLVQPELRESEPLSGSVLALNVGVAGVPGPPYLDLRP